MFLYSNGPLAPDRKPSPARQLPDPELGTILPVAGALLQRAGENSLLGELAWRLFGAPGPKEALLTRVKPEDHVRMAFAEKLELDMVRHLASGFHPVANPYWQEFSQDGRGSGALCVLGQDGSLEVHHVRLRPGGHLDACPAYLVRSKLGHDPRKEARLRATVLRIQYSSTPRGKRLGREWRRKHLRAVPYDPGAQPGPQADLVASAMSVALAHLCLKAMVWEGLAPMELFATMENVTVPRPGERPGEA
jgi:hypothetical protein